ncbi:transmembrane protein [Legionella busanensis]|uniref:Transmembrane protein n=1 Tax=Legionella busanensis TaxID=190655 RepID=A0A378JNW8_9GAMM|nr:DUF4845 domain-containing protein [Legionella busanensis]STX51889.1 transmembrane protein [Legionella busanensis]
MNKEKGITLIGFLLIAVVIVFVGILVMRVVPVYIQNYEVKNSIKALGNIKGDETIDAGSLKQKLMNQLYINGINDIPAENINVTPTDQENRYLVTVKYDVIRPIISNINLLFNFNESQEVTVDSH